MFFRIFYYLINYEIRKFLWFQLISSIADRFRDVINVSSSNAFTASVSHSVNTSSVIITNNYAGIVATDPSTTLGSSTMSISVTNQGTEDIIRKYTEISPEPYQSMSISYRGKFGGSVFYNANIMQI